MATSSPTDVATSSPTEGPLATPTPTEAGGQAGGGQPTPTPTPAAGGAPNTATEGISLGHMAMVLSLLILGGSLAALGLPAFAHRRSR